MAPFVLSEYTISIGHDIFITLSKRNALIPHEIVIAASVIMAKTTIATDPRQK
jgi:hypothetical protein